MYSAHKMRSTFLLSGVGESSVPEDQIVTVTVNSNRMFAVYRTGKYVLAQLVQHHTLDGPFHGMPLF